MQGQVCKLLLAGICILLSACNDSNTIQGNGAVIQQKRQIPEFNTLNLKGNFLVSLQADQDKSAVIVKADRNILAYITSTVNAQTLTLAVKRDYHVRPTTPIHININTKQIDQVVIDGKAVFNATGLLNKKFSLNMKGNGTSVLKGTVQAATISIEGAAHVNASNLIAGHAQIHLLGAGQASVQTVSKLQVYIKGLGQVTYFGHPPIIHQEIYGGGKLIAAGK